MPKSTDPAVRVSIETMMRAIAVADQMKQVRRPDALGHDRRVTACAVLQDAIAIGLREMERQGAELARLLGDAVPQA